MPNTLSLLRAALRLLIGRRFDPWETEATSLHVGLAATIFMVCSVFFAWMWSTADAEFEVYGINFLMANFGFFLLIAIITGGRDHLGLKITLVFLALSISDLVIFISLFALREIVTGLPVIYRIWYNASYMPIFYAANIISDFLIMFALLRSFSWWSWKQPALRAIAFSILLLTAEWIFPYNALFYNEHSYDNAPRTIWDYAGDWLSTFNPEDNSARAGAETVDDWYAREWQVASPVESAVADFAPTDPTLPTVFALSVGGMTQGVFDRESRRSLDILDDRFGTQHRSLRLINNEDPAAGDIPGSIANVADAIAAIGKRMDVKKDALVLFLTSHGSTRGVHLDGLHATGDIRPQDLKTALDAAGIENRILIISACHAGVFVPVLADDNTAIVTAAAADKVSFGCDDSNDWTYFGQAFMDRGLRETGNLVAAYQKATTLIWWWELPYLSHSEPQISIGKSIATRFPNLIGNPADLTGHNPEPPEKPAETAKAE